MAERKRGKNYHKQGRGRRELLKAAADFRAELDEISEGIWWLTPRPLPVRRVHSLDILFMVNDESEPGMTSHQCSLGRFEPKGLPRVYRNIKPDHTRRADRNVE